MEGDVGVETLPPDKLISIHALRVEGDLEEMAEEAEANISIHALRVEGDVIYALEGGYEVAFLSTPSGWRATGERSICTGDYDRFLSTPSGWRATTYKV